MNTLRDTDEGRTRLSVLWWILGMLIALLLLLWLFLPAFNGGTSPYLRCLSNLKQLAVSALLYAEDNDGRLPPASSYNEALIPYSTPREFACPITKKPYLFTGALGGCDINEIPDHSKVPLFWDAPTDDGNSPHGEAFNAIFLDGHWGLLAQDEFQLLWPQNSGNKQPEEADR